MINTKRNRNQLYNQLKGFDLLDRLRPILTKGGYKIRFEDGMFVPENPRMHHDSPWVFIKADPDMRCSLFHNVFFDVLRIIPSRCRDCWKVVARPKTLKDQFELYEVMRSMGVYCKIGIEKRPTTTSLYGAYFYCKGKEEGLYRYQEVRNLVDEYLSPGTPVVLKRYCTEYEIGSGSKGPSDKLPEMTESEKRYEEFVMAHFPETLGKGFQPDHVIAHVMRGWIHYAYKYHKATGDETYLEFTNGKPLYEPYVTYHDVGDDSEDNH